MNDGANRRRVLWIGVLGGVLLLAIIFISLAAPGTPSPTTSPSIHAGVTTIAADVTPAATAAASGGSGFSLGGGQAISLLWRLGLVVIIIAVSIAGLRWWGHKTAGPRSTTGFIKVVDTLAISNGRTIHLVALGDRVIAIGATAQQLTFLNELNDEESANVLTMQPRTADQPLAAFASELFQSMRGTRRSGRSNPGSFDSTFDTQK